MSYLNISLRRGLSLMLNGFALLVSFSAFAHEHEGETDKPWTAVTGLGVMSAPRYLGSDRHRMEVLPFIEASYRTEWGTLGLTEDEGTPSLRWGFSPNPNSTIGLQLGWAQGRKEKDDRKNLSGLGDIKSTVEYGLFANHQIDNFEFKMSINKGSSSGHDGLLFNIHAEHKYPLCDNLSLNTGLGMTWANRTYMQRYFGVSDQQSANSGLKTYEAGNGIRDIRASVGLNWTPAPNWLVLGGVEFSRLQGDAKDSPIVKKASQTRLMAGFAYLW